MAAGKPCKDPTHEKYAPPSHGCKTCTQRRMIERRAELRRLVFEHYGLSCACCGLSALALLTIDHIDPSTKIDKTRSGHKVYAALVRGNYPAGYQTLCYSCNSGKSGHRGVCPHQAPPPKGNNMVEWRRRVKQEAFSTYGNGMCSCCGESNPHLLTLHHIEGGGQGHRTLLSGRPNSWVYSALKSAEWPTNPPISVLCFTCNYGFDLPGGCPCKG